MCLIPQTNRAWQSTGDAGRPILARNHGFGGNWVYAADPNVAYESSREPLPPVPDEFPEWLPVRWRDPYVGYLQQWTHNVNLLRFFLGDEDGTATVDSVQLDDNGMTGIVVLRINGVLSVVESAYTPFHGWDEHTQIYFEKGWLKTNAPALMQKEVSATVEIYRAQSDSNPAQLVQEMPSPGWSYRKEAKHFLEHIRTSSNFRSSAEDTLHDVHLFEEIYRVFLTERKEL